MVLAFAYRPLTLGQLCHLSQVQYENVVLEYHVGFSHSAGPLLDLHTKQNTLLDTILLPKRSITVRHSHAMLTN